MIKSISVVFPCYNEAVRLKNTFRDIKKFQEKKIINNFEIIFVNDGSSDNTFQILKKYKNENAKLNKKIKIISYKKNQGKGYALKRGVKIAKFDWILTLDADISVSITQLSDWIKHNKITEENFIYFGSRNLTDSNIKFKIYRKLIGLIFIKIIKFLFSINLCDTQCGFKLYKKNIAKKLFLNLKILDFTHDIEIVLISKNIGYEVKELPVNWIHKKGSKVSIFKDSLKMFISLLKIKIVYFK
jgi:dolichyl-phosphate beta-glucosyltransferase